MFLIPSYSSNSLVSDEILTVTIVGNIHRRRWAWNPFDRDLDMIRVDEHIWEFHCPVEGTKLPEISGFYSVRFVINHSPRRVLKAMKVDSEALSWKLVESEDGRGSYNVNFKVENSQQLTFRLDMKSMSLQLIPSSSNDSVKAVEDFNSYELNGFVWDSASMFEKFDSRLAGRSFEQVSDDLWTIDVPLLKNGGIDFRADGVYQFLISADQEEDFGFSSINDGQGTLVQGTGFGSSHGTSIHSGCTVRVFEDGLYRFKLHQPLKNPHITVESLGEGIQPPEMLNDRRSFQLLGSIFDSDQFDPTNGHRLMQPTGDGNTFSLKATVKPGFHVINIAISAELFLDTMGLGCWLDLDGQSSSSSLECVTWHGKPHELNICFELDFESEIDFCFDASTDRLSIKVINGVGRLTPVTELNQLSLVGSFEDPLAPWDPGSPLNQMNPLGGGRFERIVNLKEGVQYNYKYVANRSPWALVFADYELDCNGSDFAGHPVGFGDPSLRTLRRFGRLTSHGNPPALEYTAMHSGPYRFYADLTIGSYSVLPYV